MFPRRLLHEVRPRLPLLGLLSVVAFISSSWKHLFPHDLPLLLWIPGGCGAGGGAGRGPNSRELPFLIEAVLFPLIEKTPAV